MRKISQPVPPSRITELPTAFGGSVMKLSSLSCVDCGDILECTMRYPHYQQYFEEKIGKINRLQILLNNKHLRAKGETAAFLRHWVKYFSRQAINTCAWLLKK